MNEVYFHNFCRKRFFILPPYPYPDFTGGVGWGKMIFDLTSYPNIFGVRCKFGVR